MSYFITPRVTHFIIIIPMSHPFVMHLIIHMFNTSFIPFMSLDQYLHPKLYTIPNMQNILSFAVRYICLGTDKSIPLNGRCNIFIYQRLCKLIAYYLEENKTKTNAWCLEMPKIEIQADLMVPGRKYTLIKTNQNTCIQAKLQKEKHK